MKKLDLISKAILDEVLKSLSSDGRIPHLIGDHSGDEDPMFYVSVVPDRFVSCTLFQYDRETERIKVQILEHRWHGDQKAVKLLETILDAKLDKDLQLVYKIATIIIVNRLKFSHLNF